MQIATREGVRRQVDTSIGTVIDAYLTEAQVEKLYGKWKSDWPTPLEFPGSVKAITCEQVVEVGRPLMIRTFGPSLGITLFDTAVDNAG